VIDLFLTLATFAPLPQTIEVCEINTTPQFTQVILRRWHRLGAVNGHRVAQWWIAKESPTVERIGERWLVRSEGREFWCRSVRYTRTCDDPEMTDRAIVAECDRVPYMSVGK
jgi:hypothetical protein